MSRTSNLSGIAAMLAAAASFVVEDRKFKRPFLRVAGLGPALEPAGVAAEAGAGQ